jgi:hypothetical protein
MSLNGAAPAKPAIVSPSRPLKPASLPLAKPGGGTKRRIGERRASEKRYRGLMEAAPDAMVVVNQGGDIVLLNLQAEKQFGYPATSSWGRRSRTSFPTGSPNGWSRTTFAPRRTRPRNRSVPGSSSSVGAKTAASFRSN